MVSFTQEMREVSGCRISLKRGGSGRTLLYLHGADGASRVPAFMEELGSEYEVLVPEHPGFGESQTPDWLDDIHDLAYFYLELMEQFDLRDAMLVGASLGGWLALEIAVRNSTRIRAMSLLAPSGIHVGGLPKGDIFLWSPEDRLRNLFYDQSIAERLLAVAPAPEEVDRATRNHFTLARLAWEPRLFDPALHKWLHRIKTPVQIIWGANDKLIPVGYAAEYARRIAGARVDLIAECGHLPHAEKPQEFLRLFREFASRV
jgi:pimeloyl-ACP methyl ester carboxylesterase